ncbi:hypothetical protein [Paenibacillus sp. IHBB 10380]|uniref:hypothetical protein n=1 Tax=Paenibacillus sp. IHBB 10380 TaxID=1566358 RepID=UPI0005CFEAC7|nr:hypothetical protein [Paenibacillus sp. IHBB 10380]AJS59675.1 hypothetical protein UB51_15660 [Paenibacillus sp. IHBB 10380]
MQSTQMQPLTNKELDYIMDSISNEDMLIKQCTVTAANSQNQNVQQACRSYIQSMEHHLDTLVQTLQQHQQVAPTHMQQ